MPRIGCLLSMPREPQDRDVRVSPSKPEVSAGEQTAQDKQLSDSGRVHKTVGSMAINGGPLAIGGRSTQDAMILRPEQNLTDAEVMLKVKARCWLAHLNC